MGRETSFEEHASRDGLSEESVTAARNLDSVTKNLTDKFAEGSDYFKILVEVFKDEMRKEQVSSIGPERSAPCRPHCVAHRISMLFLGGGALACYPECAHAKFLHHRSRLDAVLCGVHDDLQGEADEEEGTRVQLFR